MIKRTVEISQEAAHVTVKLDQLLIRPHDPHQAPRASIPCEDIGLLLVDHPGCSYSHAALARLAEHGGVLVVCGRDHLPAGMLLPLSRHSEVVRRIHDQIAAKKSLHKQLWRQVVVAKIRAQARNLPAGSVAARKLTALAREVRSGDPTNVEAQAARVYWRALFSDEAFRRDSDARGGDVRNVLLNYGYAVMRAAVARAVVGAGLHPSLGIHHCNRSNAFCLADDLLEPLRPIVDARVRRLYADGVRELDRAAKTGILTLLTAPVRLDDQVGPLMVALHGMVASLVRCFRGEEKTLGLPVSAEDE